MKIYYKGSQIKFKLSDHNLRTDEVVNWEMRFVRDDIELYYYTKNHGVILGKQVLGIDNHA